MSNLSIVFYGCLFYICIIGFLWNFNSFTFPEKVIMFTLIFLLFVSLSFAEYDFSLEDLNESSPYVGSFVGPSQFDGKVQMIYFGHFS